MKTLKLAIASILLLAGYALASTLDYADASDRGEVGTR